MRLLLKTQAQTDDKCACFVAFDIPRLACVLWLCIFPTFFCFVLEYNHHKSTKLKISTDHLWNSKICGLCFGISWFRRRNSLVPTHLSLDRYSSNKLVQMCFHGETQKRNKTSLLPLNLVGYQCWFWKTLVFSLMSCFLFSLLGQNLSLSH